MNRRGIKGLALEALPINRQAQSKQLADVVRSLGTRQRKGVRFIGNELAELFGTLKFGCSEVMMRQLLAVYGTVKEVYRNTYDVILPDLAIKEYKEAKNIPVNFTIASFFSQKRDETGKMLSEKIKDPHRIVLEYLYDDGNDKSEMSDESDKDKSTSRLRL